MGYFDRLIFGEFSKDELDKRVFYPRDLLAKGRVLPDEEAERSIRKFCRRHNVAAIIAYFAVVVTISWLLTSGSDELETIGWLILPFFLILALASALWYHLRLRAFVATYPRAAASRLNARGRIRLWIRSVPLCSVIHGGYTDYRQHGPFVFRPGVRHVLVSRFRSFRRCQRLEMAGRPGLAVDRLIEAESPTYKPERPYACRNRHDWHRASAR